MNKVFALMMFVLLVIPAHAQKGSLIGKWTNGSVGAISYQDRVTGATKPGRGSYFA